MKSYDPQRKPDPEAWLAMDEGERIALALDHHRRARTRLPNARRRAHAAIHAVGSVLIGHLASLAEEALPNQDPNAAYIAALQDLTAESWLRSAEN